MREIGIVNGRLVAPLKASISIDDWAVRYGWGAFESIRVEGGCPIFVERHLERMRKAALLLGMTSSPSPSIAGWIKDIRKAITVSGMPTAVLNCYWTFGGGAAKSTRIVRVRPLPAYPNRGLRLWVAPWRIEPSMPGAGVKTLAYFPYIFAGVAARTAGYDEAVLLNTAGRVADCAASSIFLIYKNSIFTSPSKEGCLQGITRGIVIGLANELGIKASEKLLALKTAMSADAAFVTSALRGVVPVAKIGDRKFAIAHPILKRLRAGYRRTVERDITAWNHGG